ncbi:3624_t:CDS:2, partial [Racocetra fulgida]
MSSELELLSQLVDEQPRNDKEVTSEVSAVDVSDSSSIHEVHSQLKLSEQIEEVPKVPDQGKTSEDMETDAFLDEVQKKSISNEIRKRNREKKLSKAGQEQISLQKISDTVVSGISSSEKPTSTKNGHEVIQEISRNIDESDTPSIQENCTLPLTPPEISFTP